MEFEDILKGWQEQPVQANPDQNVLDTRKDDWQRNQQKIFKTNICLSLGFLAAMIGIGWVYFSFKDEYGWPFKMSIAAIYCLMIVFSVISWRSYSFKRTNMHLSSQRYIQQQIDKLRWQKNVIVKYTGIYTVLLWLAMVMYIWEITMAATTTFRYTALGITTLYIFGMSIWSIKRKQKKQIPGINSLIADLEAMKRRLDALPEN